MSPRFHIDAPVRSSRAPVFAPAIASGWFIDEQRNPATQVRVRLGSLTIACQRVNRPDVVTYFNDTSLPRSDVGFLAHLPDFTGRQLLTIEVETAAGKTIRLHRQWLRLQTWPPRPTGLRAWLAERRARAWTRPPGPVDSVLVLIPVKPGTSANAIEHARSLAQRGLHGLPSGSRIVLDDRGLAPSRDQHTRRVGALAAIRQGMIDAHLRDERWVFWADLDLHDYPADLIATLIRRSEGGIAAPFVFMAGVPASTGGPLFYDVAGFVEKGRWANTCPPYFRQRGPVYDLDSVGCCYLVPADLYRRGARHEEDPGSRKWIESWNVSPEETLKRNWQNQIYTEHYSVCAFARKHGLPVRAFVDLVAMHEDIR